MGQDPPGQQGSPAAEQIGRKSNTQTNLNRFIVCQLSLVSGQ
jgi:hypothetical protein